MPKRMVLARGNRVTRSLIAAALHRLQIGEPVSQTLLGLIGTDTCGPSTNRAARQCRSASPFADEIMPPSVAHPAFEPQACHRGPHAPGSPASRAIPDVRRRAVRSPPCSVATADARLNPRPEPGWVRLASSRTNRSTACLRSASGMPGPWSVTLSSTGRRRDAPRSGSPCCRRRRPHPLAAARPQRLAVFDRILDQIGQRLADQFAVAVKRRGRGLDAQVMPSSSASGS